MQHAKSHKTCFICQNLAKLSKLSQLKNLASENAQICAVCRSIYYRWFQKIFKTLLDVDLVDLKVDQRPDNDKIDQKHQDSIKHQDSLKKVSNKIWSFLSDRSRCVQLKTIQTGYCNYIENRCCGCKFRKIFLLTDAFPKKVSLSKTDDEQKVLKVNQILANYSVEIFEKIVIRSVIRLIVNLLDLLVFLFAKRASSDFNNHICKLIKFILALNTGRSEEILKLFFIL